MDIGPREGIYLPYGPPSVISQTEATLDLNYSRGPRVDGRYICSTLSSTPFYVRSYPLRSIDTSCVQSGNGARIRNDPTEAARRPVPLRQFGGERLCFDIPRFRKGLIAMGSSFGLVCCMFVHVADSHAWTKSASYPLDRETMTLHGARR